MKKVLVLSCLFAAIMSSGCSQMKYAQTGIDQTIHNAVTKQFEWGEVYCGQGVVCAEVEVRRVDVENRDGGRVDVVLHNRTGTQVAAQIGLEVLSPEGAVLDRTTFFNIALQPRAEQFWSMPGIMQKNQKIRVSLRAL